MAGRRLAAGDRIRIAANEATEACGIAGALGAYLGRDAKSAGAPADIVIEAADPAGVAWARLDEPPAVVALPADFVERFTEQPFGALAALLGDDGDQPTA